MNLLLEHTIQKVKASGKKALYFGCYKGLGHFLHDTTGRTIYGTEIFQGFPWTEVLMDSGLLKNRGVPDNSTGEVYWTCGGAEGFWYAFCWWDRSVDSRGASNSGFYVRGFGYPEEQAAFTYACEQFPHVVQRQHHPLILQERHY